MKLSLMCGTDATADPDPNEDEQESTDTDTQSLSSSDEETQPQLNSTSVPNEDTKESTESDTESYSNTSDTHEQSASEGEETERSMEVIYAYKYIPKDYDITNNTIEKVSKSLQSSTTVIISDCIDISEPKIHELSISIDKQTLYLAVGIIPVSSINDGLETYQLHKDKQAYFKIIDKTEQIEEIELTLDTVQLSLAISMLRDDEFGNEYDNKYICKPGCVNRDRYHWALCIYGQNDVCSIQSMENYMTWNHILYVIKEGSYNNLYKQLQNILDENEIEYDEKPEDTARDINGALLDTLNEEEYQYLQRLIGIEHDDASVSSVNEDFDEEEKQEELQEDSMYQNKDIEEEIIPKTENIKRKHELIIIGYLRANTDNLHMFRARIMDRIFMFYHIKPYEYYYLEQDYDINPDANTIRKITSKSTTIIIGDCIESEFKKMHKLTIDIDGLQATSYMLIGITPKESLSKLQTHQLLLEKHTLRITGFEDISKVMLTFDASELSLSASLFDRYSNENTLKVIAREGSIEMMNYYWAICMYGKDDFCMVERVEIIASWEHLLHGIKQELYPELCTQIEEILDEDENEIKYDDIRTDITNRVFNMIDIKHTLTEDQVEYLRGLAVKTNQFRPITTGINFVVCQYTSDFRCCYRFCFCVCF